MQKTTKEEMQTNCFGETIEEMRQSALFVNLEDPSSLVMYAQCILSDAQEILESQPKLARQWINKAKYFMSEANMILRRG